MEKTSGMKKLWIDCSPEAIDYLNDLVDLDQQSPDIVSVIRKALRWYAISIDLWIKSFDEVEFRGEGKKPRILQLLDIIDGLIGNIATNKTTHKTTSKEQLRMFLTFEALLSLVSLTKKAMQPSRVATVASALSYYDFSARRHYDGFNEIEFRNKEGSSIVYRSEIVVCSFEKFESFG